MESLSDAHRAFGKELQRARKEKGVTQEALGRRVGLHATYIGDVERGERNVSLANILKIARGIEVPASQLVAAAERHPLDRLSE
jgi:transcriptional regulator with XRE-family HTH domain